MDGCTESIERAKTGVRRRGEEEEDHEDDDGDDDGDEGRTHIWKSYNL